MAADAVLEARDVSVSFAANRALAGVSLGLAPGEIVGLAGENGAGKSTLINVLTGALRPDDGTVALRGETVHGWGPARAHAAGVRAVYQELSLAPDLSVAENVMAGEWPTRRGQVDRGAMNRRVQGALDELEIPVDARERVRRLPLGTQQLVEFAKAVLDDPAVLILDEVTSALDQTEVEKVFRAARRLRERGTAVVFISHRMAELFSLCDRMVVLKDGAVAGMRDASATNADELVELMIGREPSDLFPPKRAKAAPGGAVLEVEGLSSPGAFEDVSFTTEAGEILGLGGLQGHGQKEVLQALFGVRAWTGSIRLDGRARRWQRPRAAMRDGVAYVPEDRKSQGLLLGQSVAFNASLPSIERLSVPPATVNRARERELVQDIVERLRVRTASSSLPIERLSGGNQQKVALGKWLPRAPRLYLLDEPTRGIDVSTKADLYRLIRGLADEGTLVVLTSSETMELVGLCDRIVVLFEGRVVSTLAGDEVTEERLVRASVTGHHASPEPAR